MATWPTPTPTVELRPGPAPLWDHAIDVHLKLNGQPVTVHGVSPEFAITLGADGPLLRVAPHLVPEVAACLRSVVEALEAL